MQTIRLKFLAALGTVVGFGLSGLALGHDGHDHGAATHGVVEAKTERHHFEVVFSRGGLRLYAHGADHKPVDPSRLAATATFYHPSTPKPWFSRELKADAASAGQAPTSLGLAIDLSKVPTNGAKVAFQVTGLADSAEPSASFTVPFTVVGGEITVMTATQADRAAIQALKLCPVSHEELGSMGPPLKVSRGGRSTIICCKGCLKEIKANPDRFFASAGAPAPAAKNEHHHD
jgi:hypothetical protein